MTAALLYCRVSTDPQERDGSSLSTQEKQARAYAKREGWTVEAVIKDTASGYTLDRPGLTALRSMLADVDVVLCYDFDRIARNQTHMAVLLNDIIEAGVQLCSVREGPFANTAIGKFMLNARTFAAEVEREKIAERTTRGKVEWATRGRYIGPAPYGYVKVTDPDSPGVKKAGVLVEDPETARVVRRIFDLYLSGLGQRGIAVQLTKEGVPTPRKAKAWSGAMVRLILDRDVYVGRGVWKGIAIPAPPLLDDETMLRTQAERARRATYSIGNSSDENILTGILYCSACGGRMQGDRTTVRSKGKEYQYRYYICSNYHAGRGCVSNRHHADDLEARVIEDLGREMTVTPRKKGVDVTTRIRLELDAVKREAAQHAEQRTRTLDSIASGVLFGSLAQEAVQRIEAAHERLAVEQKRLTAAIAEAEERESYQARRPEDIAILRATEDPAERKAILARHVQKIFCTPGVPEPEIVE